jgi:ribosomal protein S12 methylthiotransferase accessory factor YcaO
VDALGDAPALAAAIGEALERLRAGRDATAALVLARRVAAGEPAPASPLGAWTSGWK